MASLITVRISKGDSPNLGFRLQGGKDFATPLVIQKVNVGSPAERAGLVAGDSVIKINDTDVFNLRHKDAQDVVVRAGPAFEITLQRGGSTWKPSVVPTGSFPTPSPVINNVSPVTRTSLTAPKGENIGAIGTGHNLSAKPFSPQVNGAVNGGPKVVNKQYNSPLKLYSEESIAETLSAQTEVLSTGALGVNFKKNEKNYDASNSAVLRMLQESENEPKTADEEPESGVVTAPNSGIAGLRHVKAPDSRPAPSTPQLPPVVRSEYYSTQSHAIGGRKTVTPSINVPLDDRSRSSSLPGDPPKPNNPTEGVTVCTDCERVIVGVFVRIKDKNLHVECFKCATCGTSLKNVGYYNINNKLYCDIHAKSAAIRINANPNLVPVTVPPGGKPPVQAISSALASHSLPTSSPLSPKINNSFSSPYQPQETNENADVSPPLPNLSTNVTSEANNNNNSLYNNSAPLSFSKYLNKSSTSFSGPKPFSSVSAPLSPPSTLPRAAPLSPITPTAAPSYNAPSYNAPSYNAPSYSAPSYKAPSYSPASSAGRSAQGIIWPPPQEEPEIPTACPLFYPPPSQVEQVILSKRAQKEAELESEWSECREVEEINDMAQFLPKMSFCLEEVSSLTEHRSAVECVETIAETLETQKFVENVLKTRSRSPPPIEADIQPSEPPKPKPKSNPTPPACPMSLSQDVCCQRRDSCELKRPTQFTPNTVECQLPSKIDNVVPQKWESPLTQALRTTEPDPDTFAQIPSKHSASALASALSIAPSLPFTPAFTPGKPVPLPEETVPYMPPERPVLPVEPKEPKEPKPRQEKPKSKFVKALETAPERPFTPVGASPTPIKKKPKDPTDKYFTDLPKPHDRISLLAALTTAPDRPYSPLIVESVGTKQIEANVECKRKDIDRSVLTKPLKPEVLPPSFNINKKEPKPPSYYPPSVLYQRTEESKSEEHTEETNTSETRTIERQTIHNPQMTQIIVEGEESKEHNFAPMFQAVSCYYHNKKDNFSIEISTTPPIPTPPPKPATPIVKTIESKPGYIEKETVTEEKHARQQTTKKQEQYKEEIRAEMKAAKQAEEVVLKKAAPPVHLHKPEGLPSYQVQLSENAEADLKLMERMQKAQSRLEQQKLSKTQEISEERHQQQILQQKQQVIQQQQQQIYEEQQMRQQMQQRQQLEVTRKPVITIEPDTPAPTTTFKPVVEDRPPSTTFSPRPRSVTPSMINKPPPLLPYYQSSLAPQHMPPVTANLLDPKSPAISRSPSPAPGARSRSPSPSPFPREQRAVSPAQGPPENPLKSSRPLPTPRDSRLEQARENITTFIPEYKSKRDLIEHVQGMDYYERSREERHQQHVAQRGQTQQKQSAVAQTQQYAQPTQMYVSQVRTESYPLQQRRSTEYESVVSEKQSMQRQKEICESQKLDVQEAQRAQKYLSTTSEGVVATAISEQSHSAHLEQMKKSQSQSVQKSADGSRQVQRKTTVTEEYERSQKETNIQIEKNVTSCKKYPFHDTNAPSVEAPGSIPMHLTNPQPLSVTRSFGQTSQQQTQQLASSLQQSSLQQSSLQQSTAFSACERTCKDVCGKTTCSNITAAQVCPNKPQPVPSQSSDSKPPPVKHVFAPSSIAPLKHVDPPGSSRKPNHNVIRPNVSQPNAGAAGGRQAGGISVTPKRGRGVLNAAAIGGARIPLCGHCNMHIRGPFITALGKIWCPNHFICTTPSCRRPLQDLGFVEERGQLYCEFCFEQYLAPPCAKCSGKIKGDCLKAIGKNFHPECFNCVYCGKLFGNSPFFLEDGSPYCEADWNELFTTKCFACGFPVEAGDRWVEALNNNYHSQCFNCTMCKKNLEGQSFFAKGGRPFCKNHAR